MTHQLLAEVMSTALMIIFGVGVHCDDVLKKTKYAGTGHIIRDHYMGIRYHCLLVRLWWRFNEPAMALLKVLLGKLTIAQFFPIAIAEMIGAFLGAVIASYFMYADHFKISEGQIDGVAIRNIFSTNPNCRNLPRNYFVEAFATFIFLTSIMAAEHANEAMLPFTVGLIVWAIGMGLGGTTGFTMNQARDLGPRFAYQILPIKDKVNNDWQYGLLCTRYCSICWCCPAFFFIRYFLGIM